jgi:hypothetical protein
MDRSFNVGRMVAECVIETILNQFHSLLGFKAEYDRMFDILKNCLIVCHRV